MALPQGPAEIPKLATAQAQLDQAKEVKKESRGTKGAARVAALDRACDAFGAVVEHWPESGRITGEAAFRQGEIHRTLGRPGPAAGAFLIAVEQGDGTAFAARGQLEIGHLHRRASEFPQALKAYSAVLGRKDADLRYRNDSYEWIGKVQTELEEWDQAAAAFRSWGDNAEGPEELVKAADHEALALLGAGKLAAAKARVVEVQAQVEDLAGEPSKEAGKLRKALDRMKAPAAISAAEKQAAALATGDPA
ncbi:MAG: hypothetical protein H8E31_04220 [Planctomycetes bacterium]|nr:hypothetical protein [Planctomycetota bacterium]